MKEQEIIKTLEFIAKANKNNTLGTLVENTLNEIRDGVKYKVRKLEEVDDGD